MIILGFDPGTATTGFGLIEVVNKKTRVLEWGLIETDKNLEIEERLFKIYNETLTHLKAKKPDVFVIEKIFFATNAKTAISIGQAQGVMLLAAFTHNIPVAQYAPGTIKKVITGSGRANKKDVQKAVRQILGSKVKSKAHEKTHFDNAADALAIALTHSYKELEKVK